MLRNGCDWVKGKERNEGGSTWAVIEIHKPAGKTYRKCHANSFIFWVGIRMVMCVWIRILYSR
jgi:hypothetical protein